MRVHLIAIGGSVMHNLALELAALGHTVSGSDDEIYEPSRSRLDAAGILPAEPGWHPERIDSSLDCVILGMHARADNPEVKQAQEIGVRIYSFPEFIGEHCRDKKRIVVAGSHGKTTTTAMIMHALKESGKAFDYLVGAALEGFERNVKMSRAELCVLEGDEYLTSPLDRRSKFLHYDPDVAIITGIAWDHMNVFPTWESYVGTFRQFISSLRPGSVLIWYSRDETTAQLVESNGKHLRSIPYTEWEGSVDLQVFGKHNHQNLLAAQVACAEAGLDEEAFNKSILSFKGANMRLEKLAERPGLTVYRDFAHAPSKVAATVDAVREKHKEALLVAVFELHTFSSLNRHFIPLYRGSCHRADHVVCFYSPQTLAIKKLPSLSASEIADAFGHDSIEIVTTPKTLGERLRHFTTIPEDVVLLMMSSGRFGGLDFKEIITEVSTS